MRDLAREFTSEAESGRGHFDPTADSIFRGSGVKGGIYFHGREVVGVEFEPLRLWQIRGIKRTAPVLETPCACTDANFMLISQVQRAWTINRFCLFGEAITVKAREQQSSRASGVSG